MENKKTQFQYQNHKKCKPLSKIKNKTEKKNIRCS